MGNRKTRRQTRMLALLAALSLAWLAASAPAEEVSPEGSEAPTEALALSAEEGDGAEAPGDAESGSVILTVTAVGDCTFGGEVGSKSYGRFNQ